MRRRPAVQHLRGERDRGARPAPGCARRRRCRPWREAVLRLRPARRARRRPAGRPTSPPGPGGRRCARPGSWPGPCGPASVVASRPASAAADGRVQRVGRAAPPASAASSASHGRGEGVEHRLVAGLGLAAGDDAVEPGPQRLGERLGVEASSTSPAAVAIRRKNVPYSGPLAPPTVLHQRHPDLLEQRGRVGGRAPRRSSSAATTAVMPRSMLAPWSASPIAESSSVSSSLLLARRARRTRASHAIQGGHVDGRRPSLTTPQRRPGCGPARPTAAAARRRP